MAVDPDSGISYNKLVAPMKAFGVQPRKGSSSVASHDNNMDYQTEPYDVSHYPNYSII